MKKSVSHYISELLFLHDCVVLPEFGGFVGNKQSAKLNTSCWWGMANYAVFLLKGVGGTVDMSEGMKYLNKAAAGGYEYAADYVEEINRKIIDTISDFPF